MSIRVLFFGMLKDIVGMAEDRIDIPDGAQLGSVFDRYASAHPRLKEVSASIVMASNHRFSPPTEPVRDGDEIAFLPPVSGGTGNVYALTRDPIDSTALARQITRGEDGAVVNFEGVVRNNTKGRATRYLDYECYEPMALKIMTQIGDELAVSFPIGRIGMIHRLGRMEIGEASVAIVVAAPHRRPAFEAALEGINRLKRLVPIWKKEHFADGEVWVEGEWDSSVLGR